MDHSPWTNLRTKIIPRTPTFWEDIQMKLLNKTEPGETISTKQFRSFGHIFFKIFKIIV
jgi:hypothetical protein